MARIIPPVGGAAFIVVTYFRTYNWLLVPRVYLTLLQVCHKYRPLRLCSSGDVLCWYLFLSFVDFFSFFFADTSENHFDLQFDGWHLTFYPSFCDAGNRCLHASVITTLVSSWHLWSLKSCGREKQPCFVNKSSSIVCSD